MKLLDIVYKYTPIWFQNLMCSVKGWMIQRRRYNKNFYVELGKFEREEYSQDKELVDFLLKIKDLPIYRHILTDDIVQNIKKGVDIKSIIKLFPIIDKKFVKEHHGDFVNTNIGKDIIEMRTSGTTGSGLIFPYTVEMENKQWAVWWRYRRWLGVDVNTWCGWFGGRQIMAKECNKSPFWRINGPGKQVMFSSFHLNSNNIKFYYDEILNRNLTWLHGYPSNISRLAALIIDRGLNPIDKVSVVTTGAENVIANQIKLIKKAFPNAIIRQHYGLNEGVANISQTKSGEWKVDDDFCFVEFIPLDESNPNICKIIGTGFSNLAFPLVRYDTGDIAQIEYIDGDMKILSIDGRSSNVIKQPNGQEICEASLSIFLHDYSNIVEAQFYQRSLGEVELRIVKGAQYSDMDEKSIYINAKKWFSEDIHFYIKYVSVVEKTKAGKLKLVISDLD